MAEIVQVRDNKVDQVQEYSEGEYNEEEPTESQLPNSQFTAELNLLLVFLSLITLSTEESLNSVEKEQEVNKDAARAIKKLHTNRWETDEVRPVRRQGQRLHTRIRDSRHGRRV